MWRALKQASEKTNNQDVMFWKLYPPQLYGNMFSFIMESVAAAFLFLSFLTIPNQVVGHGSIPRLLLVSLDGFRWDYLNMAHEIWGVNTPNFDQLIANGSTIKDGGMMNVYVTKTRVNHHSIVTGLYAEEHGVVGNFMYDPKTGKRLFSPFHTGSKEIDPFWYNNGSALKDAPEPIWVTNEKATPTSFTRRSGTYLWPGDLYDIKERLPFKYVSQEERGKPINDTAKMDKIVEWFLLNEPINLGLVHISEPDETGHFHGTHSEEMKKMIGQLDDLIGHLILRLRENGLYDDTNLILTSDHGMTQVYPDRQHINLTDYVPASDARPVGQETVINIFPAKGKEKEVYDKLKKIPHTTTYWKKDIPDDLHFKYNTRIGPIIIEADPGWQIVTNQTGDYIHKLYGTHGYTNKNPDMHPIFIAHGPAFKRGYKIKQFNTVDLYPLMCHILKIQPAKHSGSLDNVRSMLVEEEFFSITALTITMAVLLTSTFAAVFAVAACRTNRKSPPISLKQPPDVIDDSKTVLLADYDGKDECV